MMHLEEIQIELGRAFSQFNSWVLNSNAENFDKVLRDGKWTTGQHLDHLIKSTSPINKALTVPRIILGKKFGLVDREEMSFEGLRQQYIKVLEEGLTAPGPFIPPRISKDDMSKTLSKFEKEGVKLSSKLGSWTDENLGKYRLPHPALGLLSIRELAYFTIFHTDHHLDILKEFHS